MPMVHAWPADCEPTEREPTRGIGRGISIRRNAHKTQKTAVLWHDHSGGNVRHVQGYNAAAVSIDVLNRARCQLQMDGSGAERKPCPTQIKFAFLLGNPGRVPAFGYHDAGYKRPTNLHDRY